DYITKNVFIPANMTNTEWYGDKLWDEDKIANAYTDNVDKGSPRTWPRPSWPHIGSGGVCTTTGDLFLWILALQGDTILSEGSKRKMWNPFLDEYGYGWEISKSPEYGLVRSHDGASYLGFNSDLSWFVDRSMVIVILCNRWIDQIYLADLMKIKLIKLIFGGTTDFHLPFGDFIQLDDTTLQRYRGKYMLPSGAEIAVSVISNQLMINATGQEILNFLVSSSQETSLLYDELTKKTEIAIDGIQEKNDQPFKDFLANKTYSDEMFDGFLEQLESYRNHDHLDNENWGECIGYQVLGTTPIWWFETPYIASTAVKLHFEKGVEYYRVYWSEKGIMEINKTFPISFSVLLMPVDGKEFVGYHLGTSNTINIRFVDSMSGSIDKLVLLSGTTKLSLEKGNHQSSSGKEEKSSHLI
ncbi:MAG: serine hydrolase domain-containing protein, partial [Candidatus Odinarchaeota archaeon]